MVEGNGVDLGAVVALLQTLVGRVEELGRTSATKADLASLATKADLASSATKADLQSAVAELRQEIREYHAAAVGLEPHG